MPGLPNLSTLAEGAVQEQVDIELQKVLANMMDPNTDHKKKRTLSIKLTLQTDEARNLAGVEAEVKSNLAPAKVITTKILMDRDNDGNAVGAEFVQALLNFDEPRQQPENVTDIKSRSGGR